MKSHPYRILHILICYDTFWDTTAFIKQIIFKIEWYLWENTQMAITTWIFVKYQQSRLIWKALDQTFPKNQTIVGGFNFKKISSSSITLKYSKSVNNRLWAPFQGQIWILHRISIEQGISYLYHKLLSKDTTAYHVVWL